VRPLFCNAPSATDFDRRPPVLRAPRLYTPYIKRTHQQRMELNATIIIFFMGR
jgi:hypothetical protein